MDGEFEEIGHSGGKISLLAVSSEKGFQGYQLRFESSRPVPMVMIGVYALPEGIPLAPMRFGGIGDVPERPPFPSCLQVYINSDSQGRFGHDLGGHLKTGHKWTVQNRPTEWESGQEYLYPDGADFGKHFL